MGRSQTHECMQPGPAHTAHLLASVWSTFLVLPIGFSPGGQGIVSRLDLGHIVHTSGVHQQLFIILEDGESARLYLLPLFIDN